MDAYLRPLVSCSLFFLADDCHMKTALYIYIYIYIYNAAFIWQYIYIYICVYIYIYIRFTIK